MVEEKNNVIKEELCIHFDTDEHQIPLDVFLVTGSTINTITKEFNKKIFAGKISPKIYVVPSKNGGFIEIFNLFVTEHPLEIGVSSWFLNFILERYTDRSIKGWADKIANLAFDEIEKEIERIKKTKDNALMNTKIALKLYIYSLCSFISSDTDSLKKWQITPSENRNLFMAKNEFYESCLQPNTGIKGIGFNRKHYFSVKRTEFSNHIAKIPLTEDDVYYKLQKVIITNPTIVDDNTPWNGRIACNNKKIKFSMDDEYFKDKLIKGMFPFKSSNLDDEMLIYFEYRIMHDSNLKSRLSISAKTVYSFNNKELHPIPSNIIEEIVQNDENPNQLKLI